jgi:hypothetical protein
VNFLGCWIDFIWLFDRKAPPSKQGSPQMPINEYGAMPSYAMVNSSALWKTPQDFIDDAKKHPDKFDLGTAEGGSTSHFILEILCKIGMITTDDACLTLREMKAHSASNF